MYFEEERQDQERKLNDFSRDEEYKLRQHKAEMEELNLILSQYRQKNEEDGSKVLSLQQQLEQKEKLYMHIKEQVDSFTK